MPHCTDHTAFTIWLTGLPASGKSDLAIAIANALIKLSWSVEVIDSGKLRRTPLMATMGFSKAERDTNVRRHGLAAKLLARNGVVAIVSSVSPYEDTRQQVRRELNNFIEVYVSTPQETCIKWDKSGLWKQAIQGTITNFTGVDAPYEPPSAPEINIDLSVIDLNVAAQRVIDCILALGYSTSPAQGLIKDDEQLLQKHLHQLGYNDG